MLENFNVKNEFKYQRLTAEEQEKRGILGRLVGPCADFKNSTRNGRRYSEELWENTFKDPIVIEKLNNRCILGELGHPTDRTETDIEKVAICLAEIPKKGSDGILYAVFDILNTPNGRILNTLCNYGVNIGVSSRGTGDVTEDFSGEESVDPDSYDFEAFDAVILPAVKVARPKYVTESLNSETTLRKSLMEEINKSTEEDRKIMIESLNNLNIDYSPIQEENNPEKDNIDNVADTDKSAAEDNGAIILLELQEQVKLNSDLQAQVKTLQEKLSVCYTKELRYSNTLGNVRTQLKEANEKNSELINTNNSLTEELKNKDDVIQKKNTEISILRENINKGKKSNNRLAESLISRDSENNELQNQINSLNEQLTERESLMESTKKSLNEELSNLKSQNKTLTEQLMEAQKDSKIIQSQATAKIEKANSLVEKYKKIAQTSVNKYMESQAIRYGIKLEDIQRKLPQGYSFNTIDRICEELKTYKINMNALPFDINAKPVKMKINESKEKIATPFINDNVDDTIDETLKSFIQ